MTTMPRVATALAAITLVTGAFACAAPANAQQQRRAPQAYGDQVVVAHSRWGHGSVSGPVRAGRVGWEVRLPRGTWIPCGRNCAEALRRATVDFWESNGEFAKDQGPGYFRWDFRF